MPIDPDAYMSGAIPTLSRGGSWQVHDYIPSGGSIPSDPPASPSIIAEGLANPFSSRWAGSGPPSHSRARFPLMNTAHNLPLSPLPFPFTTPLVSKGWGERTILPQPPKSAKEPMRGATAYAGTQGRFRHGSEGWQGGSWEKGSGAPQIILPEPIYPEPAKVYLGHRNPPTLSSPPRQAALIGPPVKPHRARAESLPAPAAESSPSTETPKGRKRGKPRRPKMTRRHTSDGPPSPPTTATKGRRPRHYSLPVQSRESVRSSILDFTSSAPMTAIASSRFDLSSLRGALPPSSLATDGGTHTVGYISPLSDEGYDRYAAHPASPTPGRIDRPRMTLEALNTPRVRSESAQEEGKATRSRPNRPVSMSQPRHAPGPRSPTSPLAASPFGNDYFALPPAEQRGRSHRNRAASHPAISDHSGYSATESALSARPPKPRTLPQASQQSSSTGTSPLPAQRQTTYLPVGYPDPTRDLKWNREGPAMRTHGIAWMRDVVDLPDGPAGPRWVQARPPRVDVTQGGSWWESGGDSRVNRS